MILATSGSADCAYASSGITLVSAEAVWFKSAHFHRGLTGELPIVVCLSVCRRDVPDEFKLAMVVERTTIPIRALRTQRLSLMADAAVSSDVESNKA